MSSKIPKNLLYCGICIAFAWIAAKLAFSIIAPSPIRQFAGTTQAHAPKTEKPHAAAPEYDTVLKRNLFHVPVEPGLKYREWESGQAQGAEDEELLARELDKLPVSQQGWTLQGTIVNTLLPGENRAILVIDSRQAAYGPGSEIKGWKISHIDRRRIVLEKGERRERLLVGGRELTAPQTKSPAVNGQLNRNELEKAMRNIPALLTQAGFEPGQRNGIMGLSLTFVKPESIFGRLGLRANDLLVRANGQPLTNLGDLAGLGNLAAEDTLRVELLRDGQNMALEYSIVK